MRPGREEGAGHRSAGAHEILATPSTHLDDVNLRGDALEHMLSHVAEQQVAAHLPRGAGAVPPRALVHKDLQCNMEARETFRKHRHNAVCSLIRRYNCVEPCATQNHTQNLNMAPP